MVVNYINSLCILPVMKKLKIKNMGINDMKFAIILLFLFVMNRCSLSAQTLYVDIHKGNDSASGAIASPLKSLQKAVAMAEGFSGEEPVTIKLAPGLYELTGRLDLQTKNNGNGIAKYTFEAAIMPDDSMWSPASMPVIQSLSGNNNQKYFDHCSGIFADRANVCIQGVKFIGNPNPAVEYYYPVEKDTTGLNSLEILQCYFIGDRYGAPIQGALYVQGPGLRIDHCIFYCCKNVTLGFQNLRGFSITHSIIYGAYEAAIWYGEYTKNLPEPPFEFRNNVVAHCRYFWAATPGRNHAYYHFDHSLICENDNYVGMQNGKGGVMPLPLKEKYSETGVRKVGKVKLVEVRTEGFPWNYLNLASDSDGKDIGAGIFKKQKPGHH